MDSIMKQFRRMSSSNRGRFILTIISVLVIGYPFIIADRYVDAFFGGSDKIRYLNNRSVSATGIAFTIERIKSLKSMSLSDGLRIILKWALLWFASQLFINLQMKMYRSRREEDEVEDPGYQNVIKEDVFE